MFDDSRTPYEVSLRVIVLEVGHWSSIPGIEVLLVLHRVLLLLLLRLHCMCAARARGARAHTIVLYVAVKLIHYLVAVQTVLTDGFGVKPSAPTLTATTAPKATYIPPTYYP